MCGCIDVLLARRDASHRGGVLLLFWPLLFQEAHAEVSEVRLDRPEPCRVLTDPIARRAHTAAVTLDLRPQGPGLHLRGDPVGGEGYSWAANSAHLPASISRTSNWSASIAGPAFSEYFGAGFPDWQHAEISYCAACASLIVEVPRSSIA